MRIKLYITRIQNTNIEPSFLTFIYNTMKITQEDIGKQIIDIYDWQNIKWRIIAIDIDGRIICDYEDLPDEVFITEEEHIIFPEQLTELKTITIWDKIYRLVPL